MTVFVQEKVLGFQIPICDATLLLVQILEHQHNLSGVESRRVLVEAPEFAEVAEDLAAGDVVEEHVEGIAVGEGAEEGGDEGVAGDIGQDGPLVADMVDLFQPDNLCLSEDFEGVNFGVLLVI